MLFCACSNPAVQEKADDTPMPTPVHVTAADLLADAMKHYEAGDYEEAIIAYLGVIEIEPKSYAAQLGLAHTYLSAQDEEAAIGAFAEAIAIDGSRPEGYIGLSDAYLALGDPSSALSALQEGMAYADVDALSDKIEREKLAEKKLLRQSWYSHAEELEGFILFEYNNAGLLEKTEEYTLFELVVGEEGLYSMLLTGGYADGILEWRTVFEYNAHKQKVKEICYCYTGSDPDVYFVYEYDGENLAEVRCYDLDDDYLMGVYDDSTWRPYYRYYIEVDGDADDVEYDEQERIVKKSDEYGYETYEYDDDGHLKKKSEFSNEGELIQYEIYEYGYQNALLEGGED